MIIVEIAGHLGSDPETRFTPNGQKVVSFRVATNIRKGGKDETVWWQVNVWGDKFDKMMPYLKKGSAVIIIGEMNKPEIWTDKSGNPQLSLRVDADIIKFSPFGGRGEKNQEMQTGATESSAPGKYTTAGHGSAQSGFGNHDDSEDSIPF